MVLYDIRREELRRDPARARRRESHVQIVLCHAVRIEHIVVGDQMPAVCICMAVRRTRDRKGDARRLLDILRLRLARIVVDEVPLIVLHGKGDVRLVTADNARRAVLVRREIDFRRCIFVVAVVGLRRLDERIRPLLIDLEIIGCDPAAGDFPRKVDLIARDRCLRGIRHLIVKLVVVLIRALQLYIFIADLVRARMNLGSSRRAVDIGRASDAGVVD